MVRLPNAKTPALQMIFRKIREALPKLFSTEEHIRHITNLHSLRRQAIVMACNHGSGGARCSNAYCSGAVHGREDYYGELAEAFIARVFMTADKPEELKQEFVGLLKQNDHIVEARLRSCPLGEAVELFIEKEALERCATQRV